MNPEVSPRGGIPDRIVTLAWPRSHGSISRQMVGHEREISRVGGALEENCKKRFYSRLFDTKDFEVLETTNGRNWQFIVANKGGILRVFPNNFYQDTRRDADGHADHLYNIFETRHRAST